MTSSFQHPIREKLIAARESQRLCDFAITSGEHQLACHSQLLAPFCQLSIEGNIDLSSLEGISVDQVTAFIDVFYGGILRITTDNQKAVLDLAQFFQFKRMLDEIRHHSLDGGLVSPFDFCIEVEEIMKELQVHGHYDHVIIYHKSGLKVHRFIVAAFFCYFQDKWSLDCPDKNDTETDFTQFFHLPNDEFCEFWASLYIGSIKINTHNFPVLYHLAIYFKYNDLLVALQDYLPNTTMENSMFEHCIALANDNENLELCQVVSNVVNTCIDFEPEKNMMLSRDVLLFLGRSLTSSRLKMWVLQCLVYSFRVQKVSGEDIVAVLEVIKISEMHPIAVYKCLKDLLSFKDTSQFLANLFANTVLPKALVELETMAESVDQITIENNKLNAVKEENVELRKALTACKSTVLDQQKFEQRINCDRITNIFRQYDNSICFFALGPHLKHGDDSSSIEVMSPERTLNDHNCTKTTASVCHPVDGRIILHLSNQEQGSHVGFYNSKTGKVIGFVFERHYQYSHSRQVSYKVTFLDSSHIIENVECNILLSFNFSKSQDVTFSIPKYSIEHIASVPFHVPLEVRLIRDNFTTTTTPTTCTVFQ
ncbi:hypothetical protein RCL1_005698 [Eukaryota sp. TZLM3-RCL]